MEPRWVEMSGFGVQGPLAGLCSWWGRCFIGLREMTFPENRFRPGEAMARLPGSRTGLKV
jgi:hypothetical protein